MGKTKYFATKTDVIRDLEESMGSEGSTIMATKLYELMLEKGLIHILDQSAGDCIEMDIISDEYFFDLWNHVIEALLIEKQEAMQGIPAQMKIVDCNEENISHFSQSLCERCDNMRLKIIPKLRKMGIQFRLIVNTETHDLVGIWL